MSVNFLENNTFTTQNEHIIFCQFLLLLSFSQHQNQARLQENVIKKNDTCHRCHPRRDNGAGAGIRTPGPLRDRISHSRPTT